MADTSPLIVNQFESGMLATMPRARPDAVFVLSYADGGLKTFNRAPGIGDRTGSKWCYIVEKSQRFSSGELRIPALGDVYFFSAWFDAAWLVTDAAAVVSTNLQFGEPVVSGFLKSALWPLGRRFDPENAQLAEEAINRALQPPLAVGNGLTLNGLTIRLALDARKADNVSALDAGAHNDQLVRDRVAALRQLVGNDDPFLVLHLAQHPDDTASALQLINQSREQDRQHRLELLDRFLANDILTDIDADALRPMVLGGAGALPPGAGTGGNHGSTPSIGSGPVPAIGTGSVGAGFGNVPALGPGAPAPTPTAPSAATATRSAPSAAGPMRRATISRAPAPDPNGPQDRPYTAGAPQPDPVSEPPAPEPSVAPGPDAPDAPVDGVKRWKPLKRPGS